MQHEVEHTNQGRLGEAGWTYHVNLASNTIPSTQNLQCFNGGGIQQLFLFFRVEKKTRWDGIFYRYPQNRLYFGKYIVCMVWHGGIGCICHFIPPKGKVEPKIHVLLVLNSCKSGNKCKFTTLFFLWGKRFWRGRVRSYLCTTQANMNCQKWRPCKRNTKWTYRSLTTYIERKSQEITWILLVGCKYSICAEKNNCYYSVLMCSFNKYIYLIKSM